MSEERENEDSFIEHIDLDDNPDFDDVFAALEEIELDESGHRPPPSFGPLANPEEIEQVEGSVFHPDTEQEYGSTEEGYGYLENIDTDSKSPPAPSAPVPPAPAPAPPAPAYDETPLPPAVDQPDYQLTAQAKEDTEADESTPTMRDKFSKISGKKVEPPIKHVDDSEEEEKLTWRQRFAMLTEKKIEGEDELPEKTSRRAKKSATSPPKILNPEEEKLPFAERLKRVITKDPQLQPAEALGLNVADPDTSRFGKMKAKLHGNSSLIAAAEADQDHGFSDLLKPLSGPELASIQAEISADEPVFLQIERRQRDAAWRQQAAFYLGMFALAAFLVIYGPTYLTETLPAVEIPEKIRSAPADLDPELWREILRTALFCLGFILPLAALYVTVESFRRLIGGIGRFRVLDLLFGIVGVIAAFSTLLFLAQGEVITAAMWMAGFWVINWLYGRWLRRKYYG